MNINDNESLKEINLQNNRIDIIISSLDSNRKIKNTKIKM